MLPSELSRRALVAGAAVAAVASAPTVVARKRKRQQPPPPLAFYSVTMTGVHAFASGSDRAFEWDLSGTVYHPASKKIFDWPGTTGIAVTLSPKEARTAIIKQLQGWARTGLQSNGEDVPADRIAVILI